jgi:hypothetical protein
MLRKKIAVAVGIAALAMAAVVELSLPAASATGSPHLKAAQNSTAACGSACSSPVNQSSGTGEELTISLTQNSSSSTRCTSTVTAAALESVPSACSISVGMAAQSSTNAGQDWTVMAEDENSANVQSFINAGALPPKLGAQYSGDDLAEIEAAPDGVPTDLCLSASVQTTILTTSTSIGMSQCGESSTTVTSGVTTISNPTAWILDSGNASASGYEDLISGVSQTYSLPEVLTLNSAGTGVQLAPLSQLGSVVSGTQMWSFSFGSSSAAVLKRGGMKHT